MVGEVEFRTFVGHDLIDASGKSIGYVVHLFDDEESGRPEWIGVLTGTLRHRHVMVPVSGAESDGLSLKVPWSREKVKQAPTYGEDDWSGLLGIGEYKLTISKEKEEQACAYYGRAEVAAPQR